jgi:quercetin dioxygenase-like cupin family protein
VTPEPQAVLFDGLSSLELEESQPIIYDRPIGMRMLYQDPVSGAEHYLIRYPAGLQAQRHTHTASHTIIVLAGRLSANQHVLGPLSYCHFPAGSVMRHAPAGDQGCLFVTIFDGPFDVTPAPDR